jgi:RNA polymerase sigma-54 factor
MTQVAEDLVDICVCVIGNLDGDGRLNATNEEIAALGGLVESAEEARQLVMRLDPVGCGARDARECLLVQLEVLGPERARAATVCLASRLISEHPLSELQQHKLPNLAKQMGVEVRRAGRRASAHTQARPVSGPRYSSDEPILIAPEVFIEKVDDDELRDLLYRRRRPAPAHQPRHAVAVRSREGTTKETRDFIKDKMRSAVDLLRNIEHRRQTIYRVVECIVRRQRDFLDRACSSSSR